jgi:hypothetical protein
MADGGPVIQGVPGSAAHITQTPTSLANGASSGDGTGLYLFSGSNGHGLYAVARGGGQQGVRSHSYDDDGVRGIALGHLPCRGSAGRRVRPGRSAQAERGASPGRRDYG